MTEDNKIKIDKFDDHDFGFWKMQIEDYLLSLAKNVAYNVVNEKTTYGLLKALYNMYEKPSASNKVFLIRQLVNTKMNEGASIADHVNEFNSIIISQAIVSTAVSGSTGSTKLKFDNICDLIIGEDIRRKTSGEYSNSLLSAKDKGSGRKQDRGQNQNRSRSKSKKRGQSKNRQDIMCWNCNQKGHFQNQCSKPVTSRDKEVNMATGDYDDALLCCIENTINDHIMDSGALHSGCCPQNFFWSSWTLKDVRATCWLSEPAVEVTKGSWWVAHGYKRGSLYMVEVPSNRINVDINGRGNATLWHQRLGHMSGKGMKIIALKGPFVPLGFRIPEKEWQGKEVSLAHLRVFGCDSYVKVKDVPRDKLDAKSEKYQISIKDSLYGAKVATDSSNLTKPNQKDQVVLEDSLDNLGNKSIVTKHGLSSKITQSPGGSSDTSEGSKNSGSFEDSGRSDEEDYKDEHPLRREAPRLHSYEDHRESGSVWKKANYKEIVSLEKNQTWSLVRLPAKLEALRARLRHGRNQEAQGQLFLRIEMKDLGPAKQILGMSIIKDRTKDAEARCQPLGDHFKLSKKQAPKTEASRRRMAKVPYASGVGSMMYTMVCTRPNIAHAMGVVSRFMSNPGREHWEAEGTLSLKKILRAKNPADMLTKVVTTEKLKLCAASTGLRDN
ncbi:retrovirus-related pol polyprotein from transposon TNT 1-94 [Tanacetum coccineum]